ALRDSPLAHDAAALDARGARAAVREREGELRQRDADAGVPEAQPERPHPGAARRRSHALGVDGDQPLPGAQVRQGSVAEGVWDEARAFQGSLWAMPELEEPVLTAVTYRTSLPAEQRDPKRADDAAERFKTPLGVLNGALAGKAYLLGDAFTVADLNI